MAVTEIYKAVALEEKALQVGALSPFTIEIEFGEGLTESQKAAFKGAADRWTQIIVGDLPAVRVEGRIVDDLLILASGEVLPAGILGVASPTHFRPEIAGKSAFLPARGEMKLSTVALAQMEADGTLQDVITHEMGHILGVGTVWSLKNLLVGAGTNSPIFIGATAMQEYATLLNDGTVSTPVPVENDGDEGTADGHWEESIFGHELMSGFIGQANNPISRVTVGSLQDMGYDVDFDAAEPFQLPGFLAGAMEVAGGSENIKIREVPEILPNESLDVGVILQAKGVVLADESLMQPVP